MSAGGESVRHGGERIGIGDCGREGGSSVLEVEDGVGAGGVFGSGCDIRCGEEEGEGEGEGRCVEAR